MSGQSPPPVFMPEPINVCKPIAEEDNFLKPVAPCDIGEGLPYAPVDWPNPGDNWSWRVGRRISNLGYYTDRFIYLPKSIHKARGPKNFASKLSLERYLKTEYPNADLNAFFASFAWKIPSSLTYSTEVKASTISPEPEMVNVEEGKEGTTLGVKRKTKHTAAASSVKRQTRQSRRQSINDADSLNKEEAASDMKNTTYLDDDLFAGQTSSPVDDIPKEFDSYLDSLVDSLAQPLSEAPLPHTVPVNSSSQENESAGAQMLEENKAKVTLLRNEYNELKENVSLLQSEIDSNLLSVQGIDDQIAQLQSQRADLMSTIETKKMAKFKLTINQKKLADAIQRTAHEIQLKTQKSQNGG